MSQVLFNALAATLWYSNGKRGIKFKMHLATVDGTWQQNA